MASGDQVRPESLWSGAFRWFFTGRAVDLAGSSMTPVAIALGVLQATGSASTVGIVMAANVVPTLILMLLGGVLADRSARGRILTITALVSAATHAAMAAVLFTPGFSLAAMSLLAAGSGMVGAFNNPALRGIVPELVAEEHIQRANASLATARNAARIGGPALAGLLVAGAGGGWTLLLDATSFLAAAFCFSRLPTTSRPSAPAPLLRDLVEGWATFCALRWVWTLSLAYTLINLMLVGPWQILGPVIVSGQHSVGLWGVLLSVRAVGLLAASTLMMKLRFSNPLVAGLLLGSLAALPLFALGTSESVPILFAAVLISAFGITASGITYEMTLQTHVPRAHLSRVASYDDLLAFAAVPLSQVLVGPASAAFRPRPVVTACAVGIVVMHLVPLLVREVRTVTRSSPPRS
ncbi:MAG: MFS transporter [Bowdeniella nasicola]|nr:MFS transporter [Bowdeniella nasicola]